MGRGEGVKIWSKLLMDSTKKLPTWGRGCQKSGKIADVVYGWSLILFISYFYYCEDGRKMKIPYEI